MEGGKNYRTFTKNTTCQDTLCVYKDTKTFCKYLSTVLDSVQSVNLFYSQSFAKVESDVLLGEDAQTFLITLTKSTNNSVTSTFTGKLQFQKHFDNVIKLRQMLHNDDHPFISVVHGKGKSHKDVNGFSIHYRNGKVTYHTLQQGCDEYLDTMTITPKLYSKLLADILSVVEHVHKKGYSINGISHQSIGYFKNTNKFKILDWQFIGLLSDKRHKGYVLYSHPLQSVMNGTPSMVAKRNITLGSLLFSNRWVRKLNSYKVLGAYSKASLMYILETYKKKQLITFVEHFDKYSLALLSIFIAEKNNINVPTDDITLWLSPFTPIAK